MSGRPHALCLMISRLGQCRDMPEAVGVPLQLLDWHAVGTELP
jgi:hypothetical protein